MMRVMPRAIAAIIAGVALSVAAVSLSRRTPAPVVKPSDAAVTFECVWTDGQTMYYRPVTSGLRRECWNLVRP